MYVIERKRGEYVTWPGSKRSYTRDLAQARTFRTREAARVECCGDEIPVEVSRIQDGR